MGQKVCVGVSFEPFAVGYFYSADDEGASFNKAVDIISETYAIQRFSIVTMG
jgi:hypothetical protein